MLGSRSRGCQQAVAGRGWSSRSSTREVDYYVYTDCNNLLRDQKRSSWGGNCVHVHMRQPGTPNICVCVTAL